MKTFTVPFSLSSSSVATTTLLLSKHKFYCPVWYRSRWAMFCDELSLPADLETFLLVSHLLPQAEDWISALSLALEHASWLVSVHGEYLPPEHFHAQLWALFHHTLATSVRSDQAQRNNQPPLCRLPLSTVLTPSNCTCELRIPMGIYFGAAVKESM